MHDDDRRLRCGLLAALGLAAALSLSGCGIFSPEAEAGADAEEVTEQDFEDSITTTEDGSIVLESDILFSPHSWRLPSGAEHLISELADEVPEESTVRVIGHTDSRPINRTRYDFTNQELSENRAQSVADALSSERADLDMTVEGRADTEPAVEEDRSDASTFAANRRVEILFEDAGAAAEDAGDEDTPADSAPAD